LRNFEHEEFKFIRTAWCGARLSTCELILKVLIGTAALKMDDYDVAKCKISLRY
jgi:hypothetical protein